MAELVVFEKMLPNGTKYELLESKGFSGHTELAIRIGGQIASILVIEQKRTGNVVCYPMQAKRTLIHIEKPEPPRPSGPPSLGDVLEARPEPGNDSDS